MNAPRLALGAMYFGTRLDDAASFALLDRFVEEGGEWIDTANCYSFWESDTGAGGQSEPVIGRWLAANPGIRSKVKIATKVGAEPLDPTNHDGPREGLSSTTVQSAINASLDRLQTDYVDLYWAHIEDRHTPLEEQVLGLTGTVSHRWVRRLGISNHPAWKVERMNAIALSMGRPGFTALQHAYSYLQPRPLAIVGGQENVFSTLTPEMLDLANVQRFDVFAYTTLLRGAYDRADRPFDESYRHEGNDRRLAELRSLAGELGIRPGQLVLSWLAGGKQPIIPILGGSTVEQLESALEGVRFELSDEHRNRLSMIN